MDEEGQRLAGLSDAEWAKRVKKIEREVERERKGADRRRAKAERKRRDASPVRRHWPLAAGSIVLALTTAVLVVTSKDDSSSDDSPPSAAPVAAGPFGGSPAETWQPATVALVMPAAGQVGPYPAAEVSDALGRARAYLLAARTSTDVLVRHQTASLKAAVDPVTLSAAKKDPIQETLFATFLAPKNNPAAPVRLKGTVTDSYVPPHGHVAGHLLVSANLVWAYALKAGYEVAPIPSHVVAIHEHLDLGFYLAPDMSGAHAKPAPVRDEALWFDTDCGYFHQRLLGLPRINDPDAAPIPVGPADQDTAFDPNSSVKVSAHTCRQS